MRNAGKRGWRPGRGVPDIAAMLALVGLGFALTLSYSVAAEKASKDTSASSKSKAAPAEPLKHALDPDTPNLNAVSQMVKSINTKLKAEWDKNKIIPSRQVDDYEFIRRASLDIIGRIARPEEIHAYLRDRADVRRSKLINRLLASEEYPRHWANLWTNWLLSRSGLFGRGMYHDQMATWLEDRLSDNNKYHYNVLVRELLTATGENTKNGGVNFILAHVGENVPPARRSDEGQFEMVPITSRITRLFLGVQVQCAQCHDHPFQTNIKQKHFWGVNAFLRQVERTGNMAMRPQDTPGPLTLKDNPKVGRDGVVLYEKRNGVIEEVKAQFLPSGSNEKGKGLDTNAGGLARREALADLLVEHEQFPKAIANRMWGVFFGRGFVNPIDDFNDNNAPANPELLDELAASFKHYDYDLKLLIRWICNSDAYGLSCVANKTNDKPEHEPLFSRMVLKALTPEQLFESLMVATRSATAESRDAKKAAREAWLSGLIANFGDDEGNEVNFNGTVVQALMMMNGNEINEAITRKEKGAVAMAVARARSPQGVVNELYLAALNRPPTAKEVQRIMSQFKLLNPAAVAKDFQDPAARYEDLFWALLNCNEFMLNH
jgi:hypothetical protein